MPDNCKFSSGEVVNAATDSRLLDGSSGCQFEEGVTILLTDDEQGAPKVEAPPEQPTAVPMKEDRAVMPAPVSTQAAPAKAHPAPKHDEAPAAEDAAVEQEAAPEEELQATVEVPDAAPTADDIAKAASAAGDNPMLAIGLAALVVIGGGGAMWKFIQQKGKASSELDQKRAEQEHELKLKELELRAQGSSGPDYSTTQPPPCQATSLKQEQAIAAMGGRVSSAQEELEQIKARISKLEKKSASFSADFDADEMRELVEKHEKEIKAIKAAKRTR